MAYRVEVGSRADIQLKQLDAVVGAAVERKIMWLSKNAAVMVHGDWSVCPMIWRACANCVLVTGAFSIGFIIPRRLSVSIESSIGLRSIGVSDIFHSSAPISDRRHLVQAERAGPSEPSAEADQLPSGKEIQ